MPLIMHGLYTAKGGVCEIFVSEPIKVIADHTRVKLSILRNGKQHVGHWDADPPEELLSNDGVIGGWRSCFGRIELKYTTMSAHSHSLIIGIPLPAKPELDLVRSWV